MRPKSGTGEELVQDSPLLEVSNLRKLFPVQSGVVLRKTHGYVHAVDTISFHLEEHETLALVGESGSGKTTTGKLIMKLLQPTAGEIFFDGVKYSLIKGRSLFDLRRKL